MLTSARPFQGEDVSLTLASVMKSDVDPKTLPPDVPAAIRTVLHRCLEKDPSQRVRDIGDVRLAMAGAFETTAPTPSDAPVVPPLRLWQRPVPVLGTLVMAVVLTALAVWSLIRSDTLPATVMRFVIPQSDTAPFAFDPNYPDLAISADGTHIVYLARTDDGGAQLHRRSLDQFEGAPIRGGENANAPFISPNGEWVGFVDGATTLRKVSIGGGPPITLTEFPTIIVGASWGADDQIIFGSQNGVYQISAGGGIPEVLTTLDTDLGEVLHGWPSVVPGRRAVLFGTTESAAPLTNPQLAVLALDTREVTRLGLEGVSPRYVPTGHLVYGVMDGSVRAVPFDVDSLEVTGTPVPLLEDVMIKNTGGANFGVSDQGALVYVSGGGASAGRTLALVSHDGVVEPLDVPPAEYLSPRLSPDGSTLVVQTAEQAGGVL